DALQPLAFSVVANTDNASADVRMKLVALIAEACGSIGMTGGQSIDLAAEGKTLSAKDLEHMYSLKTGALIQASVVAACLLAADLPQGQFEALDEFSRAIGIAFQIKDDILDVEGETHVIGKTAGSDAGLNKATYPLLFGVEAARKRCDELLESGVEHLKIFGHSAEPLRWLAGYITERGH
ncbi:MAG: polyprenyl synthetase family protein, partial [Proteobacteria bacterium]|nr:polyprenyl synthetase family protein [Pseudomonadota bacterium]